MAQNPMDDQHCPSCGGWVTTYSGQGEGYPCPGLPVDAAATTAGLRINGHGGLVDQMRQRVAGLGADILTLELAMDKGDPEAHAGAIARARGHLRTLDTILAEALRVAAGEGGDEGVIVLDEPCRKCDRAIVWRGPDRYTGQYEHANGDRTHAARPASRFSTVRDTGQEALPS